MDNIKRRSFLKNSSILTGSLVLPSFSFKKQKQLDKKLKISVVGCGGRGTGAAVQALRADKNVELVALCDAFEDRLERSLNAIIDELDGEMDIKVKDKNKFVGFDGYKKAIDLADVVILATPPGFRPQHFEYAVNKSKHIFMEKPVATDAAGVRRILESAKLVKEKKLNVVVGLQRRYQLSYLDILKQVRRGVAGKIISGTVKWNGHGVWVRKREPQQSELEYQMRNWYYFNWLCGDHIVEQHIHNLDVANWFLDEHPISAQGMGGREVRKGIDHGEIFDHHYVEFKYPSGAVIHSQCRHQPGTLRKVNEVLVGTKGVINLRNGGVVTINDHNGNLLHKYDPKNDISPYQIEHNKLFKSIRSGGQIDDTEYGATATMTAIMGRMATYSGKLIEWESAMNADEKLVPDNLSWGSTAPVLPDNQGKYKVPVPGKSV
ncbi:MAG: Gfo/Idh/MocA family oxidoreductase [Flavobacteriaceae bacterium]|jgi:predicted dehydrogenase|tara:strand:- start:44 stop:1345 length:1302 start_codon:yes stop_codon:yes gene_type:complete